MSKAVSRTCYKCNEAKLITDFSRSKNRKLGREYVCKACKRITARRYYRDHIEERSQYQKDNKKARARTLSRYCDRNPEKRGAKTAVNNAIRMGKMAKPDICSECFEEGVIQGHHEDYNKPLNVIWLCPPCHLRKHRKDICHV